MTRLDVSSINSWHSHVYFDAESRDLAWQFRQVVSKQFGEKVQIGRFHEKPVGPHPRWSFQIAFSPQQFSEIVSWLTLNHDSLDVFVHPNTGDQLRDHRDSAMWLGRSYQLNLDALGD